jgi:transposase
VSCGAFLRREGLYSSLVSERRQAKDAGLLAGKAVGRPSAEQAEITWLTRQLEVTRAKLSRTQTTLEIMGRARELLEEISGSEPDEPDAFKRGRS